MKYGTELNKRRHEILMSAGGIDWNGKASAPERRPPARLAAHQGQLDRRRHLSEVMLGIVAKRILDLPGRSAPSPNVVPAKQGPAPPPLFEVLIVRRLHAPDRPGMGPSIEGTTK